MRTGSGSDLDGILNAIALGVTHAMTEGSHDLSPSA
jgi:hypothetical protein